MKVKVLVLLSLSLMTALLPRVPVVSVPVSSSLLWQGCAVPAAVVDCTRTEGEREGKEV